MLTRFNLLKRSAVASLFLAMKPHLCTMSCVQSPDQQKRNVATGFEIAVASMAGVTGVALFLSGLYAHKVAQAITKYTEEMTQSSELLKRDMNNHPATFLEKNNQYQDRIMSEANIDERHLLYQIEIRNTQLLDKMETHKKDLATLMQNNIVHAISGALSITESMVKEHIEIHAVEDEKRYRQLQAQITKLCETNQTTECSCRKE